jgi:filamentous hemagglutinin
MAGPGYSSRATAVISYYNEKRQRPGPLASSTYDGLMVTPVLPDSARAVIDDQKVSDYLLKQDHPGNGGKAAFFLSLGYGPGDFAGLREALLHVAATGLVVREIESAYGRKFVVDGWLRPKSRGTPQPVRTVWMIAAAGDAPRFVTAYPSVRVIH